MRVVPVRIEFHPGLLDATETLGMEGQQRNYMANALCHNAYRLAITPVAFSEPTTSHMTDVTTFGPNTRAEILATILIGCERHLENFCLVIGSYMRWGTNCDAVEWSGTIPMHYFTLPYTLHLTPYITSHHITIHYITIQYNTLPTPRNK